MRWTGRTLAGCLVLPRDCPPSAETDVQIDSARTLVADSVIRKMDRQILALP
jgi:hypothetical protein